MTEPRRTLLDAAEAFHSSVPALKDFGAWPTDLRADFPLPRTLPATSQILSLSTELPAATSLVGTLQEAAPFLAWRQTYSEDQVGADFLQSYGYIELFGPTGHFHSNQLRGYIGYWGPGLRYDWHDHPAEEIYFCLAGAARFEDGSGVIRTIGPGEWQTHASMQLHAMETMDAPFLTYALWRGAGMSEDATMRGGQ